LIEQERLGLAAEDIELGFIAVAPAPVAGCRVVVVTELVQRIELPVAADRDGPADADVRVLEDAGGAASGFVFGAGVCGVVGVPSTGFACDLLLMCVSSSSAVLAGIPSRFLAALAALKALRASVTDPMV
jgi:hypothetical protein